MRFAPMMRLNSLRFKILWAYLAGMLLSLVLLLVTALWALEGGALQRWDFADLADGMAEEVRFDANGQPIGFLQSDMAFVGWAFEMEREGAYRILDDTGAAALLSNAGVGFWPEDGVLARLERGRFEFEQRGVRFYGATEPIVNGGRTWYLQVAVSQRFMELLHRVALPLVAAGIVVCSVVLLLSFGLCAWITLRYTLRPLQDVSASAMAISPRALRARLKVETVPAEIIPLVDSFNQALDRLERGYRVQQEFLGHAAHELKTPLALIRAQIELGAEGVEGASDRQALLRDVEYMTRQVQQLLLLAEASEAQNYRFAPVDMRAMADEAAAYLRRMAEAAGVRIVVSAPDGGATWSADRGALFTLLKNLLENAIEHAPAGSAVTVTIESDAVTVRDEGPGVEAEHLPLLFQRFWRAAHRRDLGAGLGLAIGQEVALAHGWQLTVERAEPGLRFRLRRGLADPASAPAPATAA